MHKTLNIYRENRRLAIFAKNFGHVSIDADWERRSVFAAFVAMCPVSFGLNRIARHPLLLLGQQRGTDLFWMALFVVQKLLNRLEQPSCEPRISLTVGQRLEFNGE